MLFCHIRRKVPQSSQVQYSVTGSQCLQANPNSVSQKRNDVCMHLAFVCVAWASLLFLTTSLLSQQEKEIENACNDNTVS